jgi:hypothetical protein
MSPPTSPSANRAVDEMNLAVLVVTYSAFTFSWCPYPWREPRWAAVRKNAADPGLYALVTPDLSELHAALTTAAVEPAALGPQAGPTEPGPLP